MLDTLTLQITYDRSARMYTWTHPETGELFTWPPKAKGEAFQFVLSLLDPDLYEAASRWIEAEPGLERVIWRGAELVARNGVETLTGAGMVAAKVQSSDEYGRYAITFDNGYLVCECPHWQEMGAPYDSNGMRVCKHLAAFTLYQRVREERF